jgi:serpin B
MYGFESYRRPFEAFSVRVAATKAAPHCGMRHVILLAVALAGCGSSSSTAAGSPTQTASGDGGSISVNGQSITLARSSVARGDASLVSAASLSGAVTANNAFAVDLYAKLRAGNPMAATTNLITSPLSASIALTMTYAGAVGDTATQMASALHYGDAASTIFDGQNALSQALASRAASALAADTKIAADNEEPAPAPTDYQLQIVNSVWGEETYTWNAPFLDILAKDYGTGVYQEDFVANFDPARLLINQWVSDETADKINGLLPEGALDNSTRMVLVNAIHLKLPWATPFEVSATASASFTTASGASVTTPFMNRTDAMSYIDDGAAQVVGLPLAAAQIGVVIALPHGDLATYEAALSATSAAIKMPTASSLVKLSLPKVTFTSPTFSLKTALVAMGMPLAFDPSHASFTGLCTKTPDGDNLSMSDVVQKATIAMQETGVEAAAATAVILTGDDTEETPPTPIPMIVNHPYVISIVDLPTGAVLFTGHVVDPTQAGGS